MTYYIFKRGTNEIINACEVHGRWSPADQKLYLEHLVDGPDAYEIKEESSIQLNILKSYRYWNERP